MSRTMPFTPNDFKKIVKNERAAAEFFELHHIIKPPNCAEGHPMKLESKSVTQIRYSCAKCAHSKKAGARACLRMNNWLEGSKLSLTSILKFINAWASDCATTKYCREQLEMGKNTAVDWRLYMREVCAFRITNDLNQPIGGKGKTVEIDESLFSKRKNHAGRLFKNQWVLGGICREDKRRFAVRVPDRSAATLLPIIRKFVLEGTHIITDGWLAYRQLAADPKYSHDWINHKCNFVDPSDATIHTQTIERMWRPFKDTNRKRHGTHSHMIDSYIAEGLWRLNLEKGNSTFLAILKDIAEFWPADTKTYF